MKITIQIDPPTKAEIQRLKTTAANRLLDLSEKARSWLSQKLEPRSAE